jgi:recombination protein RecA
LSSKLEALQKRMKEINKKAKRDGDDPIAFFAKGNEHLLDLGIIETGNPAIDRAIQGGLPRGQFVMIMGQEGTGKTCLTFDLIAHNQKLDPEFTALFIHLESSGFPFRAALQAGIDPARMVIIHARESGEKTFNVMMDCLWDWETKKPSNLIDVVVIDSVAAAVPQAELDSTEEKGFESVTVGRQAAMMSKAMRVIAGTGSLGKTCLILINQLRTDVNSYGGGIVAPGGNSVKFYPKITVKVSAPNSGKLKRGAKTNPEVYGHTVNGVVVKNNTGLGFPNAEFHYEVHYGKGVDIVAPLLDYAIDLGVIQGGTAGFFSYSKDGVLEKIRGRDNLEEKIRTDEEFAKWLEDEMARAAGKQTETKTSGTDLSSVLEEYPEEVMEELVEEVLIETSE